MDVSPHLASWRTSMRVNGLIEAGEGAVGKPRLRDRGEGDVIQGHSSMD